MMHDLIIYDTSNFQDFPIGGQMTSVRNFLKYIAASCPEYAERILLVGVTTRPEQVGQHCCVEIDGISFDFLPLLYRDSGLSGIKKSLRLEYVKGLLKKNRLISCSRRAVHYIHTPEAYIAVKLLHPAAKTAVFSHGNFFHMVSGFRFFQKNKLIHFLFEKFLVILLKTADLVFTLDEATAEQYRAYTANVFCGENSIALPETVPERTECGIPIRLLYVGRLSKVKRIDGIISAVALLNGKARLTIVGDGEEVHNLKSIIEQRKLGDLVCMEGARPPEQMREYYESSDILVMNSTVEGKPMTMLEAMSFGLPAVTTPAGGIPELVRCGAEAEFTDGTPRQIAEKVEMISRNYAVYAQNAAKRSLFYDYRRVNASIMERIQHIGFADKSAPGRE